MNDAPHNPSSDGPTPPQQGGDHPPAISTPPLAAATPARSSEPSAARPGSGRGLGALLVSAVALVVGLGVGVTLGVVGADAIRHWVGAPQRPGGGATTAAAKQLWSCGMHPQVIQDKPGNCPICGMALEPLKTDAAAGAVQAGAERKAKYWWDPMMNPPYLSDRPGKSPMGMDLLPVYEDEISGGAAITIDPAVVQNMGVRVAQVRQGPIRRTVRAVGYLEQPQPGIHDINLRISGWVEKLHADTEGMLVKQGDPLFDLYSPEVQVAVEELIIARRAVAAIPGDTDETRRATADVLVQAARHKLERWGLASAQIEGLAKLERAPRTISFLSPVNGEVMEKMVVQGAMVKMGERALRLADRSMLWLDAQIYAQDLPFIKLGQKVSATIEAMPGQDFEGAVTFIHPQVDPMTRTAKVRMTLDNPTLALRTGLFATARITAQIADAALLVPREAVLDTGTRQVVFVSTAKGHFEPRKIKTGPGSDDGDVQVLSGLAPGETVVTSGQFLMDAESRMKEAIQKHLNDKLLSQAPTAAAGPSPPSTPSDPHQGHSEAKPQAPAPLEAPPPWRSAVDATVTAYLKVSATLGEKQRDDKPLDVAALSQATASLARQAEAEPQRALAQRVLQAVAALADQPMAEQRKLFMPLSDAVIALVDQSPPSQAVGGKLFILYCPMSKGQWLQSSAEPANPYFATSMKQCAEIKRTITTVK